MSNLSDVCKHGILAVSCIDCRSRIDPGTIRLTTEELEKANSFAHEAPKQEWQPTPFPLRTSKNRVDNWRRHKIGDIAFAKFLIKQRKTPSPLKHVFDEWTDFATADGRYIYIYTTSHDTRCEIQVKPEKVRDTRIEFYVCVHFVEKEKMAYIKGFATTDEMIESGIVANKNLMNNETYETFARKWAHLEPISSLLRESEYFRLIKKGLFQSLNHPWF